jgi:hypothetical protein
MNGQTNKGKSKSKNPNKEKTNAKTLDSASRLIEGWGRTRMSMSFVSGREFTRAESCAK